MKKLVLALLFCLVTSPAYAYTCGAGSSIGNGQCRVFLQPALGSTYSTAFVLPSDWTSVNTIEAYGEGGADFNDLNIAGGGGAYAANTNLTDSPATSEPVQIGGGNTLGSGGSATPTTFKSAAYLKADYGHQTAGSQVGGLGGSTTNSIGTIKFAGGNGGTGDSTHKGTGAGGAAGPNGAGANGGGGTTCIITNVFSGGGGGGANGGFVGATGTPDTGPCTDNGTARGGTGGNGRGNTGGGVGSVVDSTGGGPATAGSGGGGGGDTGSGSSATDAIGAVDSTVYGSNTLGPSGGQGGQTSAMSSDGNFVGFGCGTANVVTARGGCTGAVVITYTSSTFVFNPPPFMQTQFMGAP